MRMKAKVRRLTALEALPCPWCGEQPEIQPWHGGPPTKRLVGCENEMCDVGPNVTGHTERMAIAAWNKRDGNGGGVDG